ncbi:hypothetical protein [Ferruginibacter sp. HRS2-29]|uniref:hypothetical protein n=1 Tax=Ferruginibacter sp. HRS2-29 TaxID=2487334 RepID=UPI0020CDC836|nr:hypothetical protein [Ferruginibacter sp. HRS2-29]MCP9751251.1 hypothetical protein [Ferruginibacter sp. HRS2-29]
MKLYQQRIRTIKDAYQAIHDFFSCYHPYEAQEEVDRLFSWAAKKKYYKKSSPADIIFCVQQLHQIFSVAEIINHSTGKKMKAILVENPQTFIPAHYTKENPRSIAWDCYPKHITLEEYLNPYWAVRKLGGIPHWEDVLQELMEAALSRESIDGSYTVKEIMKWRSNMMRIIEAG